MFSRRYRLLKHGLTTSTIALLRAGALFPAAAQASPLDRSRGGTRCADNPPVPTTDDRCEPTTDARILGQDRYRPGQSARDEDQARWRAFYGRDYTPDESPGYGSSGWPDYKGDEGDGR